MQTDDKKKKDKLKKEVFGKEGFKETNSPTRPSGVSAESGVRRAL